MRTSVITTEHAARPVAHERDRAAGDARRQRSYGSREFDGLQANPQLTFSKLQIIATTIWSRLRYHVQNSPTDLGRRRRRVSGRPRQDRRALGTSCKNVPATSANNKHHVLDTTAFRSSRRVPRRSSRATTAGQSNSSARSSSVGALVPCTVRGVSPGSRRDGRGSRPGDVVAGVNASRGYDAIEFTWFEEILARRALFDVDTTFVHCAHAAPHFGQITCHASAGIVGSSSLVRHGAGATRRAVAWQGVDSLAAHGYSWRAAPGRPR